MGQPAMRKIGSARAMIVPLAIVGAIRLGSGRGVENIPVLMSAPQIPTLQKQIRDRDNP
jgi:hypothetical protein